MKTKRSKDKTTISFIRGFGFALKALRERAGKTLNEVGKDAEMATVMVWRLEHPETYNTAPTLTTVLWLAQALGTTPSELVKMAEDYQPQEQ